MIETLPLTESEIMNDLCREAREFMSTYNVDFNGDFVETCDLPIKFNGVAGHTRPRCWLYCHFITENRDKLGLQITFGVFSDKFPQNVTKTFYYGIDSHSPETSEAFKARVEEQKKAAAEKERKDREIEKKSLQWIRDRFDSASPEGKSPYFERKKIQPPFGLRYEARISYEESGKKIEEIIALIPLRNIAGDLLAIQEIYPSKKLISPRDKEPRDKNFVGKTGGCFYPWGVLEDGKTIYLCEGVATAGSIYIATKMTSVAAISRGNLLKVGSSLQEKYPNSEIVVCADDDHLTDGNPGKTDATKAAKLLGCGLCIPEISGDCDWTDFNDLHVYLGIEEVKKQIKKIIHFEKKQNFTQEEIEKAIKDNEIGDANLFKKEYGNDFVFDPDEKSFYRWGGSSWILDKEKIRMEKLERVATAYEDEADRIETLSQIDSSPHKSDISNLRKRATALKTARRMKSVLELSTIGAKNSGGLTLDAHWDNCAGFLPCANGLIDLSSGELLSPSREQFIRKSTAIKFDPSATCPVFESFVLDIMSDSEELAAFLQRLIGYAALGIPKEHIFAFFYGPLGRNGKGTFLRALLKVLGHLSKEFPSELLLLQRNPPSSSTPRADLLHLQGCRFATFSEINEGRKLDSAVLKNLSGGDPISARGLFSNEIKNFLPSHTLFLQANHRPQAPADDNALWRRAILIPFSRTYVDNPTPGKNEKRIDHSLHEKLDRELPGILNWVVEGCKNYQKEGLRPPQEVVEAVSDYKRENDGIGAFLEERCETVPGLSVKCSDFRESVKAFCERGGFNVPTKNQITSYLESKGFKKHRSSCGESWVNLMIKKEEQ